MDLIWIVQPGFYEIFQQVFTSDLLLQWLQLAKLTRTPTMGHFRTESALELGSLWESIRQNMGQPWATGPAPSLVLPGERLTRTKTSQGTIQEAVVNPSLILHLQVGPILKPRLSIYISEKMIGDNAPLINYGRPFCQSYHLKGLCNLKWGGRHAHIFLLVIYHGILPACTAQLYESIPPLVM